MKVSAKTEYACIAMFELAAGYDQGEPIRIRTIADKHGIPSRFLVQILLQLKGAGWVLSTRGASGGYRLAQPPETISLADIISTIEGPAESEATPISRSKASRVLASIWNEIGQVERDMLSSITLDDLVRRAEEPAEGMYYI